MSSITFGWLFIIYRIRVKRIFAKLSKNIGNKNFEHKLL
jgi:hypothetical protein